MCTFLDKKYSADGKQVRLIDIHPTPPTATALRIEVLQELRYIVP